MLPAESENELPSSASKVIFNGVFSAPRWSNQCGPVPTSERLRSLRHARTQSIHAYRQTGRRAYIHAAATDPSLPFYLWTHAVLQYNSSPAAGQSRTPIGFCIYLFRAAPEGPTMVIGKATGRASFGMVLVGKIFIVTATCMMFSILLILGKTLAAIVVGYEVKPTNYRSLVRGRYISLFDIHDTDGLRTCTSTSQHFPYLPFVRPKMVGRDTN